MTSNINYKKGFFLTFGCYLIWGVLPLYWLPVQAIDPLQLMAQRICWSLLFLMILVIASKQTTLLFQALTNRKIVLTFLVASLLLFTNWTTYLWAITSSRVLDASLGYYMNPLVSIFLGRIFLKESLSRLQYFAIIIASFGVLWLAILGHSIPYIALLLAFSFGLYGLIKKTVALKTIPGLTLETLFMMPFAIFYLIHEGINGRIEFLNLPILGVIVLLFSGVATTVPLLLFSEGAKHIPLSLVGMIQYIAPTTQFFLGIFILNEEFSLYRFIGFIIVWIAVFLLIVGEWQRIKRARICQ